MIMITDSIETLESSYIQPDIPASQATAAVQTNQRSHNEGRLIDQVSATLLFGAIGLMMLAFGSVMTGFAFTLEADYLSLAAATGCRTDIAGPILTGIGGAIFCYCCGLLTGPNDELRFSSKPSKNSQSLTLKTQGPLNHQAPVRTVDGIQYYCSNEEVRF